MLLVLKDKRYCPKMFSHTISLVNDISPTTASKAVVGHYALFMRE